MKEAGLRETKESEDMLYWYTRPCVASRNLMYTKILLVHICTLRTQFVAP